MIAIGRYNELEILRETSVGLFLGDEDGEDVLLPNKYCPETYDIGDMLVVFVYLDYEERKVATNLKPKIYLHQFAMLKVTAVSEFGAFLDWGMEKNLMVPFSEQRQKMEEGRWYVVYLDIDERTDRLYATNKIERRLKNEDIDLEPGEEVDVLIYRETELGYSVIVDNLYKGLVFKNEVFKPIRIGDRLTGYVKKIRDKNKIDISLQPIGYLNFIDKNSQEVYRIIEESQGYINITDKSSPDEISMRFGMSKKAFKKAVGDLYKQRKIVIEEGGIRLVVGDS